MTKNELQKLLIKNLIDTHQDKTRAFNITFKQLISTHNEEHLSDLNNIAKKFDITI